MGLAIILLIAFCAFKLPESFALDQELLSKTNEGISFGQTLADTWQHGKDEESKLFKRLGKISAYLGAVGGVISLVSAFLPEEESAELQLMRTEFERVNGKLDSAMQKIDQLPNLIEYHTAKNKFYQYSTKINYGYSEFQKFVVEMQTVKCSNERDCKIKKSKVISKYQKRFDVGAAQFAIVNGAMRKTSEFNDPMIDVIQRTFKCDVSKIQGFSNGILRLSYKAQQAILAFEKLTGSKHSISVSLKSWMKLMYELRQKTMNSILQCYKHIKTTMLNDISDADYQRGENSDQKSSEIAGSLRSKMNKKYPWLDWVTIVYNVDGSDSHCVRNVFGNQWYSGKRNVVALPVDKNGNFRAYRSKIEQAIRSVVYGRELPNNACQLYSRVMTALAGRGLKKYISSWVTLVYDRYHKVGGPKHALYSNHLYDHIVYGYKTKLIRAGNGFSFAKVAKYIHVRFIFSLNSEEQIKGSLCNDKERCSGNGKCHVRPLSSETYCICKEHYCGDKCESRTSEQLAATVDKLLDVTMQLPTMTEIQYDIKDLREFVGVGFGDVLAAIKRLEQTVVKASESIKKEMAAGFKMANFVTQYSETIFDIEYYNEQLQKVSKFSKDSSEVKQMTRNIASKVLGVDRIEFWLYKIDSMIRGREAAVGSHKPLLLLFIEKYGKKSCTQEYKKAVDNFWRRMFLLQERGFMLWARSREIMGLSSKEIVEKYKQRTKEQVHILKNQKTCTYFVPGSENIRCAKGMLLPSGVSLDNRCMKGFVDTGMKNASCENKVASCSRDCIWNNWSSFTGCPCGNDQVKYRTRSIKHNRVGQGKLCSGSPLFSNHCFRQCCHYQFDCKNNYKGKRCISLSFKCNYKDDCGNDLDENHCKEKSSTHEMKYVPIFDREARDVYRPEVSCGNRVLSRIQYINPRDPKNMRIRFTCNELFLTNHVCSFHSYRGYKFDCGPRGFLTSFRDSRNYPRFRCCKLKANYHKTICTANHECGNRYFLSSTNGKRCCKILTRQYQG